MRGGGISTVTVVLKLRQYRGVNDITPALFSKVGL